MNEIIRRIIREALGQIKSTEISSTTELFCRGGGQREIVAEHLKSAGYKDYHERLSFFEKGNDFYKVELYGDEHDAMLKEVKFIFEGQGIIAKTEIVIKMKIEIEV